MQLKHVSILASALCLFATLGCSSSGGSSTPAPGGGGNNPLNPNQNQPAGGNGGAQGGMAFVGACGMRLNFPASPQGVICEEYFGQVDAAKVAAECKTDNGTLLTTKCPIQGEQITGVCKTTGQNAEVDILVYNVTDAGNLQQLSGICQQNSGQWTQAH